MEKDLEELKILYRKKGISVKVSANSITDMSGSTLSFLRKDHLKNVFVFLSTALVLFYADRISASKITTSAWGFRILMGCAIYYALSKAYMYYRLGQIDPTQSVLQTIRKLEFYKKLNEVMMTYGELAYLSLISFGVYLYLQPIAPLFEKHNAVWIKLVWGTYVLWAVFNAFFIKRKKLRKEISLLENYIQTLISEH